MGNEQFGFFHHERETLAVTRQLRASGLKLSQIARQLAEMGYVNRRGVSYSECSISRILKHKGSLSNA